jgi:uncharacterized protein YbjQ (UPF0145 family)
MKRVIIVAAVIAAGIMSMGCISLTATQGKTAKSYDTQMHYWDNSPYISVPGYKDFDTLGIITVTKTVESDSATLVKYTEEIPITYAEIMAQVVSLGGDAVVNVVVDSEEVLSTFSPGGRQVRAIKYTATGLAIKYTTTLNTSTVTTTKEGETTVHETPIFSPVGTPHR